ncbi:MAG: quinoprotein dehydrogenase-associated SoxYZ-like carrier [Sphingomonas sp.]
MAGLLAVMAVPVAAELPRDPLASPTWQALGKTLFGDDPVRFDDRVKVSFPAIAEDQHSFPVTIDARGIAGVTRILLFADLNPIPLAIDYSPDAAQPFLSTRIKLDQRTPVRGAVQLADGSWLVSGGWIDAAGGGCSAPPVSRVKGDWADHLGEVRGIALRQAGGTRVRLTFRHPMDTGFVANIPTYHLEHVALTGPGGKSYGEMQIEASVAEDPAITIIADAATGDTIIIAGNDTNGIDYGGSLTVTEAPAVLAAR